MYNWLLASLVSLSVLFNITLVQVTEPEQRLSQRVVFVVDRSGSMHGDHFSRALNAVRTVLEQPLDEFEIALIAFNDAALRWPGKPEPDAPKPVPPGWAAMPNPEVPPEIETWLQNLGAGGSTRVMPALAQALKERRNNLSVVLVTDGLFEENPERLMVEVEALQQWREQQGLGRAVILVYGMGAVQKSLLNIVAVGKGGYFTEIEEEPEPDLDGLIPAPLPPK